MRHGIYFFMVAGIFGTVLLSGCSAVSDPASTETTSAESSDAEEATYWDVSYMFQEDGAQDSAKWIFCPDGTLESIDLDCSYRIEESDGERWLTLFAPSGDTTTSYKISDDNGELHLTTELTEEEEAWRLQFSSGTDGLSAGTECFDGTYVHPDYPDYQTVFCADATVKSTLYETYTVKDNLLCITGITGEEEYAYTVDETDGTLTLEKVPADGEETFCITLYEYVPDDELDEDDLTGSVLLTEEGTAAMRDFAVRLFQESVTEGENTLVSPLSVLEVLALAANGAEGNTLAQMEELFGLSVEEMNDCLWAYRTLLPSGEQYQVHLADAIWLTDDERFTVEEDFLQTVADAYEAEIFQTSFGDGTSDEINGWVSENTDGMIGEIVDEVPEDAVMYLVNAIAFDAEWEEIYEETQVNEGEFTAEDGTVRSVDMMYSEEGLYLEDDLAAGFVKYYADESYAFVAMLPNEGVTAGEYASSLTGEDVSALLDEAQEMTVYAAIPRFESEYSAELSDVLAAMGMKDAFLEEDADFSGLGYSTDGNLYINRVLHKTHIAVDEKGTEAGAASAVEMVSTTALLEDETQTVYLDRPFVYMIIDCEENVPIFIGMATDIGA